MSGESYTPGHTENATAFMAARTFESHGQFFADYLEPGLSVLDCGCGPGTIAQRVAPGPVTGIDFGKSQVTVAQENATDIPNVSFQTASCYDLPFANDSFDRVFSNALFEHLNDPVKAMTEFHRVLKPGGIAGICSPDWRGFLFAPESNELMSAVRTYRELQTSNGGDVKVGRKLGVHLAAAGFNDVRLDARCESYEDRQRIGEYLAQQLDSKNERQAASAFREWSTKPAAMFAQTWVWAIGVKRS